MASRSTPIPERSLRGLHPESLDDPAAIRSLLRRASEHGTTFHRGLNAYVDLETAKLLHVAERTLVLDAANFDRRALNGQMFLNFAFEGRPYFFETRRVGPFEGGRLVVELPATVFHRERRDRARRPPDVAKGDPSRVRLVGLGTTPDGTADSTATADAGPAEATEFRVEEATEARVEASTEARVEEATEAHVADVSPSGLGLLVPRTEVPPRPGPLTVRYLDGCESGREARLELRSAVPAVGRQGWTRLGLVRHESAPPAAIAVERIEDLDAYLAAQPGTAPPREKSPEPVPAEPRVLRIEVAPGEELIGLVDGAGAPAGATAVVMPNGWGQTKEALLPLARTLVSTFRAHGLPIEVIRYDGLRRKGESYRDPECRVPGRESQQLVFSQGVRDLEALVRHLRESPEHGAARVIVVSFSAAAIEVRKAVARDGGARIDAWVSVVGSPDLQSMARSISGGVDYVGGHERGHRFGVQELLGVRVDIDRIAVDAVRHEMSFLEDSRRDLAATKIPITWYHGRHDGWVDLARVRDILSHGDLSARRLVELPTGHQLRTSKQAAAAFALIAGEVARLATGRRLAPVAPPARVVRHLRVAESRRLPVLDADLQAFWRDYLMGRDRSLGIELLTAGSAYGAMMAQQIASLALEPGQRVADLGAGTGAFALALARRGDTPPGVEVVALDYVREALVRARRRLDAANGANVRLVSVESDLDLVDFAQRIPLADASCDGVIASLLLSYLECPELALGEALRILRPGGRLVVSSLCRDADISQLYFESLAELESGAAGRELPELAAADLGGLARNFLNDAARILELEGAGAFRFMDPDELVELVRRAGFDEVSAVRALGSPPQAVVVSATRS